MKSGEKVNFIVVNQTANSLYSLIADGQFRATFLGRHKWKTLLGSDASLQYHCNREGFNPSCSGSSKARIGILSNNKKHCGSCDSLIGFGNNDPITCGNEARGGADNGNRRTKAFGYILVQ